MDLFTGRRRQGRQFERTALWNALEIEEFGALRVQRLGLDALRAPGGLRLTRVRVLQNTVLYVGRVAMQALAFLAEKDLAARTNPAARWPPPRLQHARFFRGTTLPTGRGRECSVALRPSSLKLGPGCLRLTCPQGRPGHPAARTG